ncbi:Protein of unknown function [Gryllus bimaculatus]|nr:Protein of unknown function [Gryllus bimaculatus]
MRVIINGMFVGVYLMTAGNDDCVRTMREESGGFGGVVVSRAIARGTPRSIAEESGMQRTAEPVAPAAACSAWWKSLQVQARPVGRAPRASQQQQRGGGGGAEEGSDAEGGRGQGMTGRRGRRQAAGGPGRLVAGRPPVSAQSTRGPTPPAPLRACKQRSSARTEALRLRPATPHHAPADMKGQRDSRQPGGAPARVLLLRQRRIRARPAAGRRSSTQRTARGRLPAARLPWPLSAGVAASGFPGRAPPAALQPLKLRPPPAGGGGDDSASPARKSPVTVQEWVDSLPAALTR